MSDETLRWIVETSRNVFDDVGANKVTVAEGGALVFYDESPTTPSVIYAPGQWLTVVPELT